MNQPMTFNQKIAFAVAAASFLAAGGSGADLVTLFGAYAKYIIAVASLSAGIGGVFLGMVTGTNNVVKDVVQMAKDPNSPVQGIVTTATPEGEALAKSIPGPIYKAGTDKALDVAQP